MANVVVKKERLGDYYKLMDEIIPKIRKERGNLRFDMIKKDGTTNNFTYYEAYKGQAGLNAHFRTRHFKKFRAFWKDAPFESFDADFGYDLNF